MKLNNLIALTVVLSAALSCTDADLQQPTLPENGPEQEQITEGLVKITLTVGYDQTFDGKTKVALNNDLSLSWQVGDEIGVCANQTDAKIYKFTAITDGPQAQFSGYVPEGFVSGKAFYPYSAIWKSSTTDNFRVFGVPASVQHGVAGGIDRASLPMVTSFDDINDEITFHHLSSIMRFSVQGNDVCEIKLQTDGLYPTGGSFSDNDVKCHGALSIPDFSFVNVGCKSRVFNCAYRGEGYVILRPSQGDTFAPGQYCLIIPATADANPRTLENLTVTYTKTDGTKWSISSKAGLTVHAGVMYDFSSISESDCTQESSVAEDAVVGKLIPAWKKGYFDIHFINTMAGEGYFLIFPDGTQMLIDASGSLKETGSVNDTQNNGIRKRYDPTKDSTYSSDTMFEEYIRQCMIWTENNKIDYVLNTHFHNDHFGKISGKSVSDRSSTYKQQSLAYMLDVFQTGKVIDRGYPKYDYPTDQRKYSSTINNWATAVEWHVQNSGVVAEKFNTGVTNQIVLKYDAPSYPTFSVRNIGVNGEIWTGVGTGYISTFPAKKDIVCANPPDGDSGEKCPAENINSAVAKFTYGNFDFWAGGDQQYNDFSNFAWKDSETPMAKACGQVDVMKADHHGTSYTNGYGATSSLGNKALAMKYLRPRVWIVNNWVDGQPRKATYEGVVKLCDVTLHDNASYPWDALDTFITNTCSAQKEYSGYSTHNKGADGHIVVRVLPGGDQYYVYVLKDFDRNMVVKTICGPYTSR